MGKSLLEIAQQLKDSPKKVQLIYAFNGIGKTRLSREFRLLVDPKNKGTDEVPTEDSGVKIIYFNAFTEDLFYWDNDLNSDTDRKLKIQSNSFTNWVLAEQGQEPNIVANFQHYTNNKLTPRFNEEYTTKVEGKDVVVKAYSEVKFSIERGDDTTISYVKIFKGEESNFVWCVFYSLLEQVVEVLNVAEPGERETAQFNDLKYVFIDDPVSSLDDNHLIELAVNLAQLIKSCKSDLKFVITTHNPLFYNVLHNELEFKKKEKKEGCYLLEKHEDGTFNLSVKFGDSNKSFSYHLHLKQTIKQAIERNDIQRYHFTLLRNLYEKTANFLGYPKWSDLLPGDKKAYLNRIIQFTSHSTLSSEAVAEPNEPEKQTVNFLLDHLIKNYSFWQEGAENG